MQLTSYVIKPYAKAGVSVTTDQFMLDFRSPSEEPRGQSWEEQKAIWKQHDAVIQNHMRQKKKKGK